VSANFTTCVCPAGYELRGKSCYVPVHSPKIPSYVVVLIVIGGAMLIGVVVFLIVRYKNKKSYTQIKG